MSQSRPLADAAMPMDLMSLQGWMSSQTARFEVAAARELPPETQPPAKLHAAMRYAVLDGGKRIRPLLAYAAGLITGAEPLALDRIALAVEFVHSYSLVHDDLPCMDNDVLRRGKPTAHVAFGVATAMLAGDALQAEAFRLLSEAPLNPLQTVAVIRELAEASGPGGMCGGQAIDLDAVGRKLTLAELETMHRLKTGALLRASVIMGASAGAPDADVLNALRDYAKAVGLAFQVVDDVLDVAAPSGTLGKTAGKDAAQDKPTYVSLLGIEQANALANRLHRDAQDALAMLPNTEGAIRLRQLADFIVCRSH